MSNSDDEDAFLYGSDEEGPTLKKQKTEISPEKEKTEEKDAGIGDNVGENGGNGDVEETTGTTAASATGQGEDEQSEEEDEESDDDIEFVIGDSGGGATTSGAATSGATSGAASTAPQGESGATPTTGGVVGGENAPEEGSKKAGAAVSKDEGAPAIDLEKVAELDGKPLTQVDLQELKDQPWRIPGADISDYFNYGFDEFTWTAYCHKQDKLRGEFNPKKVMANMMEGAAKHGGMFPFPQPNMPSVPSGPSGPKGFKGTPPPFRK